MRRIVYNYLSVFTLLFLVKLGFSADLIVEEFGLPPTYSSIQMAVDSASDGDRILIMNRAGGIPWIEDVTINKSLELLSYTNDTFFIVQGNYTILASSGRNVTINGMYNTSGAVVPGAGTGPTEVNIFDSYFSSGSLDFDDADFSLNLVSSTLQNGYITLYRGNILGNDLVHSSYYNIYMSQTGGYTGDTVLIIGNKIYNSNTSYAGIYARSSQVVFHIKNNWIRNADYGIYMYQNASTSEPNLIYNNTILMTGSSSVTGIYVYGLPAAGVVEIMNNVIDETSTTTSYGIYTSTNSGQVNAYYNHIDNSHSTEMLGTYTYSSNNTTTGAFTVSASGVPSGGSSPIDGGNPAGAFSDLDLSTGDAGCYGGSFTLDNFFPLYTGSARVFYVIYPYNVRQGSTLSVEGYSYDR